MKNIIFVILLIIPTNLTRPETDLAGQPEYFPLIEGTHVDAYYPSLDGSGQYIAFTTTYPLVSAHQDIVKDEFFNNTQVYVFNRDNQTYELISKTPDGKALKYGGCYNVKISGNGNFVGFNSISFEFVPFSPEIHYDIQAYGYDRAKGTPYLISKTLDGAPADKECILHQITWDGRYFLFSSGSSKLIENDSNEAEDIFLYDRVNDSTQRVSLTQDNRELNSFSVKPCLSGDGRFLVFASYASNWASNTNLPQDHYWIVLKDLQTHAVEILSKTYKGNISEGHYKGGPAISRDGRWIAFIFSDALLPNLPDGAAYIYLYDRVEKQLSMVDTCELMPMSAPLIENRLVYATGYYLVMSGDGRYLFWHQGEQNYSKLSIYRYDRILNHTDRIIYASNAPPQEISLFATEQFYGGLSSVNYDGSVFSFTTGAKELTPLWNQGTYKSPFSFDLWPTYRLVLLNLPSASNTGGWSLFR
jgi:Tol biopolymer transport system component